jgi:hypothetical protein
VHSSDTATYNLDYAAKGPFGGFKPCLGTGAPNVLWTEGSAEMMLAAASLGQSTSALSASLNSIAARTPNQAPLQADQTVTSPAYGAEYHVWPAAAAGAWTLLAHAAPRCAPESAEDANPGSGAVRAPPSGPRPAHGMAPISWTLRAAASIASSGPPTRYPAASASPAPVVSIASTGGAG